MYSKLYQQPIIIYNQMDQTIHLSSSEKAKLENQKQIYCILRMMNFVEKFYSTDKIDQHTYKTQISKLLQKYTKFSQIIPGYNLAEFEKKYAIPHEEISWAKYVIQKGVEGQQGKQTFIYMQATATFIQVIETLNMASDNPIIGQIRPPLQKLQLILKKIYQKLGPQFTTKFNMFCRLMDSNVNYKSINESLTQSEFKELKSSVEGMYKMMQTIMQN